MLQENKLRIFVLLCFVFTTSCISGQTSGQSTVFSFDFLGPDRLFSSTVDDLSMQTIIAEPANFETLAMDFNIAGDQIFAIDRSDPTARQVGMIDPKTGVFTSSALLVGVPTNELETGLAVDPTNGTVFLSTSFGGVSALYTLDMTTGEATIVGPFFNTTGPLLFTIVDIAVDNNGVLFAHDAFDDSLYRLINANLAGVGILVGTLPFDSSGQQGMDFDPATNTLYAAVSGVGSGTGSYGIWDVDTGLFTEVNNFSEFADASQLEMTIRPTGLVCTNALGDINGDGFVTLLDVGPFVAAISDGTFICEADVNQDGIVDLLDVGPFVDLF